MLRIHTNTHVIAAGGIEVDNDVDLVPVRDPEQGLRWETVVHEPDADVSYFDAIAAFAGLALGAVLAPFSFGASISLGLFVAGSGIMSIHVAKEICEDFG